MIRINFAFYRMQMIVCESYVFTGNCRIHKGGKQSATLQTSIYKTPLELQALHRLRMEQTRAQDLTSVFHEEKNISIPPDTPRNRLPPQNACWKIRTDIAKSTHPTGFLACFFSSSQHRVILFCGQCRNAPISSIETELTLFLVLNHHTFKT